jgi:hypothetical protein
MLIVGDIKMLYVFVDIKIDSLHFVETVKANLDIKERISLGKPYRTINSLICPVSNWTTISKPFKYYLFFS